MHERTLVGYPHVVRRSAARKWGLHGAKDSARRWSAVSPGRDPRGSTGDLARRKLLPGLFHLSTVGFIPGCRIVGVSLDDLDVDGFRRLARAALDEFSSRKVTERDWESFSKSLDYVPLAAGAQAVKAAVQKAEQTF